MSEFRETVRHMLTSDLIACMASTEFAQQYADPGSTLRNKAADIHNPEWKQDETAFMARLRDLLQAVADELDRRIPRPE